MKIPKKKSIEIKPIEAWAVFDKKGLLYAQTTEPEGFFQVGSGRGAPINECQTIRILITPLSNKKVVKKKVKISRNPMESGGYDSGMRD